MQLGVSTGHHETVYHCARTDGQQPYQSTYWLAQRETMSGRFDFVAAMREREQATSKK